MALKNLTPEKLTQSSLDDRAFLHLFKCHSAIMLLIEPQTGVIIEANLAAVKFYGYPKTKLCGMSIADINILPSGQVEAERQKAKNEGRNYLVTTQRLFNGQERKVEDYFSNFIYQQKHLLFSIVNDITGRMQAEDTLLSLQKFRAAELVIANQELSFQNDEKAKRAAELVIANHELSFQNQEKEKRAAELVIANQELSFQNDEKEKRAAELVITNAYLENLINSASAPIIVWDPQLCITRFNHAFEFLTGRSEAEMLGQTLEVLFPSALVNKTMAQIRKSLLVGRGESVEIKILHRDASVRTVLWNFATLYEPDGKTTLATIAQGQDITRRKQMEDALKDANLALEEAALEREAAMEKLENSQVELKVQNQDLYNREMDIVSLQERYFNLYDLAPVGYCTLNAEGLILEANLTAANLLGVTRESMRNCLLSRFIERNSQDLYYFHRKKFIKTGMLTTGMLTVDELQMVKQDGAIFWAQVESSLILTDKNELQARILISDISERKRIQNLLQITEKRLSVLAEYSRVLTWEVDAEGLINYISPSCLAILGYTVDEIKDKKHFYDLHPVEGRAAMKAAAFEVFERQIPFRNFENMLLARDGQVIYVSTNALPILDESGKLTGYSGVDTDITERKQAEAAEMEREAGKCEQAVLAKADAERRLLLDNIQTQVWYMTDDHTYGIVNAAHAAFVGVSKESLAFKRLYDFIQKDRMDHFTQDVKQVFATGQAIRSEFRLPNADAEWRLLNIPSSNVFCGHRLQPDMEVA
ncbi:MAG: PAS domain S-box protein, partial [Chloroflexota bacterium]